MPGPAPATGPTERPTRLPRHLRGVPLPPDADVAALQERYGSNRSRIGVIAVAALVSVPFVAWVIWAGFQHANQELRWETVRFSEVTDESVQITFDVFLPDDAPVECTVRALDLHGVEVGRAQVPVRAQGSSTTVVYALPVTARPSSAFVDSCRLTG